MDKKQIGCPYTVEVIDPLDEAHKWEEACLKMPESGSCYCPKHKAITDYENRSKDGARSAAAKKGWVTRRHNIEMSNLLKKSPLGSNQDLRA